MLAELILVAGVRDDAARTAPGDADAAATAVRTALCAYIAGASLGEAARAAHRYLEARTPAWPLAS